MWELKSGKMMESDVLSESKLHKVLTVVYNVRLTDNLVCFSYLNNNLWRLPCRSKLKMHCEWQK